MGYTAQMSCFIATLEIAQSFQFVKNVLCSRHAPFDGHMTTSSVLYQPLGQRSIVQKYRERPHFIV